jgi:hypothetical protein
VGFALLTLSASIACFACLFRHKQSSIKWWARTALYSGFGLVVSAACLVACAKSLRERISAMPFGISRNEVRQRLGSPTRREEPGMGTHSQPITNSAIWFYDITVPPFEEKHSLEFVNDKVVAK